LSECKAYSFNFCERNDAYEYSLVHGKPAVGRGGRPPKVKSPIPNRDASRCIPQLIYSCAISISHVRASARRLLRPPSPAAWLAPQREAQRAPLHSIPPLARRLPSRARRCATPPLPSTGRPSAR
jgi:hypothetical protein